MPCTDRQTAPADDWTARLRNEIREFCMGSPENSLKNKDNDRAWDEPLVGFSTGSDPLFQTIREKISPSYMTPVEVFEKAFPGTKVSPDELSVISWILPQPKHTKSDNRKETVYPSERWARSKAFGEPFNAMMRRRVVEILGNSGVQAVAPVLAPFWSWEISERYGIISNWSERHAAFVSGLGTFGLCDGLITPVGKAMRCGSVVARIALQPSVRPYTDHHEYCLYFTRGTCGKCIERCPAGAITADGHDKMKCYNYLHQITTPYVKDHFDIQIDVCGLCQTAVPCESGIPPRK